LLNSEVGERVGAMSELLTDPQQPRSITFGLSLCGEFARADFLDASFVLQIFRVLESGFSAVTRMAEGIVIRMNHHMSDTTIQ
jgi:hypothetical protein